MQFPAFCETILTECCFQSGNVIDYSDMQLLLIFEGKLYCHQNGTTYERKRVYFKCSLRESSFSVNPLGHILSAS